MAEPGARFGWTFFAACLIDLCMIISGKNAWDGIINM
jgi:hypothetical protein